MLEATYVLVIVSAAMTAFSIWIERRRKYWEARRARAVQSIYDQLTDEIEAYLQDQEWDG